jgi:hypothetical protein
MAESKKSSSNSGGSNSKKSGGSSSTRSGGSSSNKSGGSSSNKSGGSSSKKQRSARDVVGDVAEHFQELIGRPIEAVLGVEKDGDEWSVSVEVLELERIPNTTDVLGKYDVTLDGDGEIVSAKRTRRYLRSQSGDE